MMKGQGGEEVLKGEVMAVVMELEKGEEEVGKSDEKGKGGEGCKKRSNKRRTRQQKGKKKDQKLRRRNKKKEWKEEITEKRRKR